jgi:hypothetical protein
VTWFISKPISAVKSDTPQASSPIERNDARRGAARACSVSAEVLGVCDAVGGSTGDTGGVPPGGVGYRRTPATGKHPIMTSPWISAGDALHPVAGGPDRRRRSGHRGQSRAASALGSDRYHSAGPGVGDRGLRAVRDAMSRRPARGSERAIGAVRAGVRRGRERRSLRDLKGAAGARDRRR